MENMTHREKFEAIERAAGGPVAAAKLCGRDYVTWWRWKNLKSFTPAAECTINLLLSVLDIHPPPIEPPFGHDVP